MGVVEVCICGITISLAALYKICIADSEDTKGYDVRSLVMKMNRDSELPPHKKYTKNK